MNINDIRSYLELGGARSTLFQVQIFNNINTQGNFKVPFLCKAAQIPASTLGTIEVPYYGRKIKLAGDRTFEPWTVTIINDEDFVIRNAMEEWSNQINTHLSNLRATGSSSPNEYKSNALVTQFSKTGDSLRTYTFNGIYPESVSSIDLDWAATDTIEEFQVTFQYDWWEVDGATGNAGGPV